MFLYINVDGDTIMHKQQAFCIVKQTAIDLVT